MQRAPDGLRRPPTIDTHVHVVSNDLDTYPLDPAGLPGAWYREAPHTAEQVLERMDAAGVERAVVVQAVGAYSYDNRYAADAAARHPDRLVGVCCVDVLGDDPVGALTYWVEERGMRGVRLFALARGGDSWLAEPRTFPVWERAAKLGTRVVVTCFFHQLPELADVLPRFPGLPVALDHCGFPPLERAPWPEVEPLLALASHPSLHLKVSTNVLDAASRGGDPAAFARALVGRFGARRVMWGSDFSQTHDRSYGELVRLGRAAFAALSEEDRAWCLGGTAARLWPTPGEGERA